MLPALVFPVPAEDFEPFPDESRCDNKPRPGVAAFRDFVLEHLGGTNLGIGRACNTSKPSGHYSNRAWDWGIPSQQAGDQLIEWLMANDAEMFRRAGLAYWIWDHKIFSPSKGVHDYRGASPHTDHVHLSFSDAGAEGFTSFYTHSPSTEPPGVTSGTDTWPFLTAAVAAGAAYWLMVRRKR